MKQTKTFFSKNNRLNKGYAKRSSNDPTSLDSEFYRKKTHNNESANLSKKNESNLPHAIKQEQSKSYFEQLISFFTVCIISVVTLGIFMLGGSWESLVFAGISFGSLAISSVKKKS
jgi:hypothetical protein